MGLCRYPNLGILDGSLSLAIDGRQYAFHGSRRAPSESSDLTIGPLELQILEPMGRQTLRNERHLVMDATRLDQFGAWSGWIRYDGFDGAK